MKTKESAQKAATKLLKKITTPGWSIRIHENLGWHYCLEHEVGGFSLHEETYNRSFSYWCLLSEQANGPGGSMLWSNGSRNQFTNPNAAIKAQLNHAEDVVSKLIKRLHKVRHGLGLKITSIV